MLPEGRDTEAIHAMAIAVILEPPLMKEFRHPDPKVLATGQEVFDEVQRIVDDVAPRAGRSPDAVRWDLDLLAGGFNPTMGPAWQAVSEAAEGDVADAHATIQEALHESPYDPTVLRAAQAVARMACDRDRYEALTSILGPFGPADPNALTIVREHIYREDALSSYNPPQAEFLPGDPGPWPWSLIGNPLPCADWPDAP